MTVFLDGRALDGPGCRPESSVGEAIDRAKAELHGTGAVIFGIRCDGEEVPSDRLKEVLSRPLTSVERVELSTGHPQTVVLDVLEQTRRAFVETYATVQRASERMAAGNLAEGMACLAECVGTWGQVHEAIVQGGALVNVDFNRLVIGERHILDWLKSLTTKLREIKSAIESRDNVLLGDILRYELDEMMQGWEHMLDGFMAHVKALDPNTTATAPAG
ncbi:MAG: hypothetical protein ACE5E1_10105 [Phycisphaerae bacterium]